MFSLLTERPFISIEPGNLNTYPLAIIYEQATGSAGGTLALLLLLLLSTACCNVGTLLTCSRAYWALARDGAAPLSAVFARVDEGRSCPVPATLFVGVVATGLGAVALGSDTAFLDLAGSFVVLMTASYAVPLVANLATGRRCFPAGPFHMGHGRFGWVVNGLAMLFIVFFDILFCFREYLFCAPSPLYYEGDPVGVQICATNRADRIPGMTSICHPHDDRDDELQQRHPGRHSGPLGFMVSCTCGATLSRSQGDALIHPRRCCVPEPKPGGCHGRRYGIKDSLSFQPEGVD